MFDKRGTGMSDRVPGVPTLEQQVDDIIAVMDAAGSARASTCPTVCTVVPDAAGGASHAGSAVGTSSGDPTLHAWTSRSNRPRAGPSGPHR
jgi:hypothetical protein